LRVEDSGWLDWWPEPLVPHAGSDYRQETTVSLARTAKLFFCEAIGPGRVALGETWAWRRLTLGLTIRQEERPILRERFDLSATHAAELARLGGQPTAWMATCVIIGVGDDPEISTAIRALHVTPVWIGASRLPGDGAWSLRIVAPDGQRLRDTLTEVRRIFAGRLPGLSLNLRRV
jgi:urease accessory protein